MFLARLGSPRTALITLPEPAAPLAATTIGACLLNCSARLATSSRLSLRSGSVNLSSISTCPVTRAPASLSMSSTRATESPVCGIDSTRTLRPVSLLASRIGAASRVNCSCLPASASIWVIRSRYPWFCLASELTWLLSASESGLLSAAVPTTRPIASARQTAVSETTWDRKLLTGSAPSEQPLYVEHEVVPPLGEQAQVGLPDGGHGHRRGHRRDRGQYQQQQRGAGDVLPVQPADPLGVDQLATDLEPGQERGSHPAAALVEEPAEVGAGTHGHDPRSALLVRAQHRPALARV